MIASNFFQLKVVFQNMYPATLRDTAQVTSAGLMSQIGGLLSLWLGVTAMTIFEFVELFYRITRSHTSLVRTVASSINKPDSTAATIVAPVGSSLVAVVEFTNNFS